MKAKHRETKEIKQIFEHSYECCLEKNFTLFNELYNEMKQAFDEQKIKEIKEKE